MATTLRLPTRLATALVGFALPTLSLAFAQSAPIPGRLLENRAMKAMAMELPEDQQLDCLIDLALRTDHTDFEEVALYVDAPLSAEELDTLEQLGVDVIDNLFVPSVPGRHALGFHIARIPHPQLEVVAAEPMVRRLATVETRALEMNDTSTEAVGINAVINGECVFPRDGSGAKVAVIDSGFDLSLVDLPIPAEALDVSDGDTIDTWGLDVGGPLAGHGTHVVGTIAGNGGYSDGKYAGGAPDASLYLYKTWNDIDGFNYVADMIKGIQRAVEVEADILNISVGAFSTFMDGTSPLCQAVDSARESGVFVVVAAGNDASSLGHVSYLLEPGETSPVIYYAIDNFTGSFYEGFQKLQVLWRDDVHDDANISLEALNLEGAESLDEQYYDTSERNTEARSYTLEAAVDVDELRIFELQLTNEATDGDPVLVHLYRYNGLGFFDSPDNAYTTLIPGIADGAFTVGAWTSRSEWTDVNGDVHQVPPDEVFDVASFSSRGPRIDGLDHPDVLAPGAAIISLVASEDGLQPTDTVDDDGVIGEGEAHYGVRSGTSFAAPMVCAAAALLLEADPDLTADELEVILASTASQSEAPDTDYGHGLIDVQAALQQVTGSGCDALIASTDSIDALEGGTVEFLLSAGEELAGDLYLLLGSLSGTEPGIPLDLLYHLPLNDDPYLTITANSPNIAPLTDTFGPLNALGKAQASVTLGLNASGIPPGSEFHHAFVVIRFQPADTWFQLVSNTVLATVE